MRKITIFLLIYLGIFILLILFFNIFQPAYYSYIAICSNNSEQILKDAGYVIAGSTTLNTTTDEIKIQVSDTTDIKSIKHEMIHMYQFQHKSYPICNLPVYTIAWESLAYIAEYIPSGIFEKLFNLELKY